MSLKVGQELECKEPCGCGCVLKGRKYKIDSVHYGGHFIITTEFGKSTFSISDLTSLFILTNNNAIKRNLTAWW